MDQENKPTLGLKFDDNKLFCFVRNSFDVAEEGVVDAIKETVNPGRMCLVRDPG